MTDADKQTFNVRQIGTVVAEMDILVFVGAHTKLGIFGIFIILRVRLFHGKARVEAVDKDFVADIKIGDRRGISAGSRVP